MSDRTIRENVRYLAGTHQTDSVSVADATVESVDIPSRTCVVTAVNGATGSEMPDVRLMPSIDDGLLFIPAVGSTVTVLWSIFTDPIIVGYTELDSIVLQGGALGGMVQVQALTIKLNNIEELLNDLISKYNTHTHNVTAVGSPTGPTLAPEADTLTLTEQSDIENINITQG